MKCSLKFVDNTRKNGLKLLSLWKKLFFEMFVSLDHLDPKNMILYLEQWLSKYLLDPQIIFIWRWSYL